MRSRARMAGEGSRGGGEGRGQRMGEKVESRKENKRCRRGTFLVVRWLRLRAPCPGQGTKIPHAAQRCLKNFFKNLKKDGKRKGVIGREDGEEGGRGAKQTPAPQVQVVRGTGGGAFPLPHPYHSSLPKPVLNHVQTQLSQCTC